MASPFFDLAQLWQQGQQQQQNNAYRNALLQLNQQNQQLRARQALQGFAVQKLLGGALSQQMAQPATPFGQEQPTSLPQVPSYGSAGGMPSMSSGGGLPALQQQVLGLEGNRDVIGRAGEIGPGQILPSTGAEYGYAPSQLLGDSGRQASGRIVADLYQRSGQDPAATLVGYNRGPGAMARFQAAGDSLSALKTPLAPAYQKAVEADLSPEARQQGGQVAIGAAGMLPPQMVGRGGPDIFARLVERVAGSNAPDDVKGAALMQLLPLMSQEGQRSFQQAFEMMRFQTEERDKALTRGEHQQEFGIRQGELAETRKQNADFRQQMIDIQRQRADQGQQKIDQSKEATLDDKTVSTMAQQYLAGDRSVMQNLGRGAQGAANIVKLRGEIAKQMAERGMSGQDMAVKMAEFEGLKAGERTLTQRTANIGMRIAEAKTFAPLALAASDRVDRTKYPTINSLLLAAEKGTGGEDVVRLSVATQSLLNAYAAAVTPTGTPTEGAQSRAHELLDKAWSQGQFRVAIDQLMMEMEAASKSPGMVREEFRRGADPGQSTNAPGGRKVGDVIEKGGKRWRVIGGDPNDPDVEPAQ